MHRRTPLRARQDGFLGFLRGNVMKYLWRYEMKNGEEDLEEAKWYLDKLISELSRSL